MGFPDGWKNRIKAFLILWRPISKDFRQINVSNFLLKIKKKLLKRRFHGKLLVMIAFLSAFPRHRHSVEITESYCNATFFSQNFRENNFLLMNFTLNWFDEKNLHGSEFFVFPVWQSTTSKCRFFFWHFNAQNVISWKKPDYIKLTNFNTINFHLCTFGHITMRFLCKKFVSTYWHITNFSSKITNHSSG